MSTSISRREAALDRTRRLHDRVGDTTLHLLTGVAAVLAICVVAAIVWTVVAGAWPALRHAGVGFLWHQAWDPVIGRERYGARSFVIGTLVTSFGAILIAAPLGVAIGLFLTETIAVVAKPRPSRASGPTNTPALP